MKLIHLVLVSLLAVLAACDKSATKGSQNLLLIFGDQEQDVEPFKTRILLTPDYLRFDDGESAVDYLVFDRKQKTIYSIVQESQSVTVVSAKPLDVKPSIELNLSHKLIDDMHDAPTMEGVKPQHHVYLAGDKICFEVVSVPGFLPAFVEAMQEFNTVLANDSAAILSSMPADMHDACSLAKSIFAPNRYFQAGFPLQRWSSDGSRQVLLDFKRDHKADSTLFDIPSSYKQLNIQEIRASLSAQP